MDRKENTMENYQIQKISMYKDEFNKICGFEIISTDRFNLYHIKNRMDSKFVDHKEKAHITIAKIEEFVKEILQKMVTNEIKDVKLVGFYNYFYKTGCYNQYWIAIKGYSDNYRDIERKSEEILYQNYYYAR
jgi:hypothetical protein